MCFPGYKANPDTAEKGHPVKSVRPHLRTTPFAQCRKKLLARTRVRMSKMVVMRWADDEI